MAAGRLLLPGWMPAVDSNGDPIPNAKVYFYFNKTSTLAPVYSDESLNVRIPNPVEANATGRFPAVWADGEVLYSASVEAPYGPAGVPFTYDNLSASLAAEIVLTEAAEAAANDAEVAYQNILDAIQAAQDADGDAALAGAIAGEAAARDVVADKTARAVSVASVASTPIAEAIVSTPFGEFRWVAGDQSANVSADPFNGIWIAPTGDPSGASGAWKRYDTATLTPDMFGAAGNGSDNDFSALTANGEKGSANLETGKVYYFGSGSSPEETPTFEPVGDGSLKWSNITLGGYKVSFDIGQESTWVTPDSWFHATRIGASVSPEYPPYAPPGRGDITNIFNTVFSQRSSLRDADLCQYVAAFGSNIGVRAESWAYTNAFGCDAMMFAVLSDRNTALGGETMTWLGSPDRQFLVDTNHDFYRNTPPNEWTAGNNELEALHPGIGMRIYNYAAYATLATEVSSNVAVGRNALCHLVKGNNNTAEGTQAGVMLWEGSYNSFFGSLAGRNMVFGSNNTAIGMRALEVANDTNQATAVGFGAARSSKSASNTVAVGYLSGDGVVNTTGAVLLGAYAGSGYSGSLQNKMVVANAPVSTRNPLLSGDLLTNKIGLNIPIGAERSSVHLRTGTGSGLSHTPSDGLLIEGSAATFICLESAGGTTGIDFASTSQSRAGSIEYAGGSNQLLFRTNNGYRLRLLNDGTLRPEADNTQPLGATSQRWSTVYAGTGTINTSDAREKTNIRAVDDDLLDAWAKVELVSFQWLSSVVAKGDLARVHHGLIAQQVRDALDAHGIDGRVYGLLCYDEWEDEFEPIFDDQTGDIIGEKQVQWAGNLWGIRPDQCLFVEAAYNRRRCAMMETRLDKLESEKQ